MNLRIGRSDPQTTGLICISGCPDHRERLNRFLDVRRQTPARMLSISACRPAAFHREDGVSGKFCAASAKDGRTRAIRVHPLDCNLSIRKIQVTVSTRLEPVKSSTSKQRADTRPQFLAGNLALDFLNTRVSIDGELVDLLQTDQDVLVWLEDAGFRAPNLALRQAPLSLLRNARVLRENLRLFIESRKAGRRADPEILNNFLSYAQSHPRLIWKNSRSLTLERVHGQGTSESLLAPIAEAAAVLLTSADFRLVKRCEGEGCVLWFIDKTKSHRRRWCSTKICGNRHKVAAFRQRLRHHGTHA